MKIGIFDSGIGGLSVLHQAMIIMPEADYIFYADVDNVPYGEKTKEEVRKLVDHAVGFLFRFLVYHNKNSFPLSWIQKFY